MPIVDRFRRIKALGSRKIRDFAVRPPAPAANRHGLAIVCIVRNVAADIVEWIEFHRRAGAAHILVYDNGSTDRPGDVLRPYLDAGTVTILPWRLAGEDADTGRHITAQVTAYAHAITTFGGRFERMAFIDVDEFMVPKGVATLMEAIEQAGSPSNLSLPWHMFGHSDQETRPDGGVVRNFTRRAVLPYARPDILLGFKCIVDPCRVTMVSVHYFRTEDLGDRTANAQGMIVPHAARKRPDFFTSGGIQLNHYYCMSRADLSKKIERGPVNFASADDYRKRVLGNVREIERATETDLTAVRFLGLPAEVE